VTADSASPPAVGERGEPGLAGVAPLARGAAGRLSALAAAHRRQDHDRARALALVEISAEIGRLAAWVAFYATSWPNDIPSRWAAEGGAEPADKAGRAWLEDAAEQLFSPGNLGVANMATYFAQRMLVDWPPTDEEDLNDPDEMRARLESLADELDTFAGRWECLRVHGTLGERCS